ncbi:hypothetical protein B0T36_22945 [Nocardia donostiensis]|nr:hypothetical protein B0T36_22945 [Nocardia donostiensis]
MNTTGSPRPDEPDVHLSVFLHGARFDYVACRTAAEHFTREWNTTQPDTATILPGIPHGIPRLPNERLYLYP